MPEKTKAQLVTSSIFSAGPYLERATKASYETYRTMRKHPTIALARKLTIAPILSSSWSYEFKDNGTEEMAAFIKKQLEPLREHLIRTAILGQIDFGWQCFEKILGYDEETKQIVLKKLKPLLQDITQILIDEDTGAYIGVEQYNNIKLTAQETLLISADVEGTQWYGQPLLENARQIYNEWIDANEGASRYDRKLAGSHWVVYYPLGSSEVDGEDKDNFEVAKAILDALEASGSVIVPSTVANYMDELKSANREWQIEILSDTTPQQPTFISRLNYLDALLVRAMGWPERSMLEGTLGTKAEAETHSNLGFINLEQQHRFIVQQVNWHIVNHLIRLNYGAEFENQIFVEAAPISDNDLGFFRDVYKNLITDPNGLVEEFANIDIKALRDRIRIPSNSDDGEPDFGPLIETEETKEDEFAITPDQQSRLLTNGRF